MPQLTLHSPVGELTISEESGALVALDWGRGPPEYQRATPLLVRAKALLERYFDGVFEPVDLPLAPAGSGFRRRVWQAMQAIPLGETRSYGVLADGLGSAPRAVGGACGANPIPILIPCHRVVAGGGLGGYSGGAGLVTKVALLKLEGALP